jgi:membrane fusion protein, multidrug efflux system
MMAEAAPTLLRVEGITLKPSTHAVRVRSQGMVQARTRSTLLPEVTGRIIEVSSCFNEGGFFEKDAVLLKLDPLTYETALVEAQAEQARAESLLAEEEARAAQAIANWKTLGHSEAPPPMVSRQPQLRQNTAEVAASKARVKKAERDLERCIIRAPYAGQVLEQTADVGQLVTPGSPLGTVFAIEHLEVRLPLPERDIRFVSLPELYRDGSLSTSEPVPTRLHSLVNGSRQTWEAGIFRVESAIDAATRQLIAVALVDDPFARRDDSRAPLKIGQFVEAEIQGEALNDVFIIPRSAVRAGNEVILITPEHTLRRVFLEPLTGDEKHLVVSASQAKGPKPGDVLCITPIPFPADGAKVQPTIDGVAPSEIAKGKKPSPEGTHAMAAGQ